MRSAQFDSRTNSSLQVQNVSDVCVVSFVPCVVLLEQCAKVRVPVTYSPLTAQLIAIASRATYAPLFFRPYDGTEPKCWNKFEPTTLVGWRGPMLRVDRVEKLPRHLSKVWFDPFFH